MKQTQCQILYFLYFRSSYMYTCLNFFGFQHFAHDRKSGSVGSFDLNKGTNRFCLAQPGVYKLRPDSCHKFEKEEYIYDTYVHSHSVNRQGKIVSKYLHKKFDIILIIQVLVYQVSLSWLKFTIIDKQLFYIWVYGHFCYENQ